MDQITTVGIDLAKSVFQVHGVDATGAVVVQRRLRRAQVMAFFAKLPPCLVGMEACATAHYWARQLRDLGHDVRLIPPRHVKAYVRRNKNDRADAEAICEAVTRPRTRNVPIKSEAQQAALMMHRARDLLVRQRTMLVNALRGHLAEFGIVAAQGLGQVASLVAVVADEKDTRLLGAARATLAVLVGQIREVDAAVAELEARILAGHQESAASRLLATIPGIGPFIASAIVATVPDPSVFRNGREFAAWLGLVPRQNSTGGKERLGGISKQGDRYLRRLLVNGAFSALRSKHGRADPWLVALCDRKPLLVAAVAVANKLARVAWAVLSRGKAFHRPPRAEAAAA
jgi:transposase